jgi:hypothetical protein
VVVVHLEVSPRRQVSQVPHDTDQGTITVWPTATVRTPAPTAMTSATHSWPMQNGPRNGTGPQMAATAGSIRPTATPACSGRDTGWWMGSVSPSHRPARNGRTSAQPSRSSTGSGAARQSSRPVRRKCNSRIGDPDQLREQHPDQCRVRATKTPSAATRAWSCVACSATDPVTWIVRSCTWATWARATSAR